MKTAFEKLATLIFVLFLGVLLLTPMRAGVEDLLTPSTEKLYMNIGETVMLSYVLQAEEEQAVNYTSMQSTVVSVDASGLVTALAPGKAQIRLQADKGARANVEVEVHGTPITSFTLNATELVLEKGTVSGLSAIFNKGATDQRVEWLSADSSVAKVDAAGRVTAVGAGETYIVATTPIGFSAAAHVKVNVHSKVINITPSEITVGVGASFPLDAYFLPEDSTDVVTTWRSDAPDVITVDANGNIRARSEGTATITVETQQGLRNSIEIIVEPAATDFQINPTNVVINRGERLDLETWFVGENGEPVDDLNHHISWTNSNPSVATVENGQILARSTGVTRVVAAADGKQATCLVRVQTPVRSVTLDQTELYLLRTQTSQPIQLTATIWPSDADNPQLTYTTNNPQVANVSNDGLVTLTGGYGTAVITATADSGVEATFTVSVVVQLPDPQEDIQ